MKITKISTDPNGDSVLSEINVDLQDAGDIGWLSKRFPVKEIIFRETGPDYDYDFHNAPQKQFVISLDGETEIETSLGEKHVLRAGDILLSADTTGKGHRARSLDGKKRRSIFVVLGDDNAEFE